ncbi:MAG: hypothetical protein IJX99_06270 [Clostridia bacterium]|nr:hypothetical protein [Clostridia bacterium]
MKPHPAGPGWQLLYKFPNGYGASVIRWELYPGSSIGSSFGGSYGAANGLWELAVLDSSGEVCYTTPITDDVLGYLTPEEVNRALTQIKELSQPIDYLDE